MDEMLRPHAEAPRRQGHESAIELLGESPAMIGVRDLIARVAETDATVLIRGESGTGKELVARAVRAGSPRRDKPFVKVNCAALPAELLESEMFGVERGAFTGALQSKPGKFEFANHGTIFLDEIGEMLPTLQAKLLHVLQDGEFSRLGGGDVRVDVRIIAATNRALEDAVASGIFREDLFFRLNVVCIQLPPLRERRDEIPMLVRHFLTKYSAHYNRPGTEISRATLDGFMDYDWPGNVRELENVIQRIVILGADSSATNPLMPRRGDRRASPERRQAVMMSVPAPMGRTGHPQPGIAQSRQPADHQGPRYATGLPEASRSETVGLNEAARPVMPGVPGVNDAARGGAASHAEPTSLKLIGRNAARAAERELMLRMLHRTRWNRKEAAEILGISYKALLYKIKEHRLDDPLTDPDPPAGGSTHR